MSKSVKLKALSSIALAITFVPLVLWADNAKFNPASGILDIPIVEVPNLFTGKIDCYQTDLSLMSDSSELAFSVTNVTPITCGDNSGSNTEPQPSVAVEKYEIGGLNVALQGCSIQEQSITCRLLLTNNEFDRTIGFCGNHSGCSEGKSTAFDDLGNQYFPSKLSIGNNSVEGTSYLQQRLVADITTEATITFNNISTRASELSLLELGFDVGLSDVSGSEHRVSFRNTQF